MTGRNAASPWQRRGLALLTLALVLLLIWAPCAQAQAPRTAPAAPGGLAAAVALEEAMVTAIQKCEPSVVAIARVRNPERAPARMLAMPDPTDPDFVPNDFGSGVIIDAAGLVLTNYHVLGDIENSTYWVTTIERQTFAARPKGADPRSDLAVLELITPEGSRRFPPITFGDGAAVRKGQLVLCLGNPYAIARDGSASASWGIISNLARKIPFDRDSSEPSSTLGLKNFPTLIQTDARLNLGTSGGALIDLKGRMIGLTTSLAAIAGHEQPAGYAIPIDATARRIIDTLKAGREVEYGFLGVMPANLSYEARMAHNLHGVRIEEVVPGTPASQSGLRRRDIVTAVEGVPIYDKDGLMLEVGKQPVGKPVRLSVLRGDPGRQRQLTLTAELAKLPVDKRQYFTMKPPSWRGLRIDYATAEPEFTRVNPTLLTQSNCVVREVEPGSAAARAGLVAKTLITHVAGRRVRTPKDFWAAVRDQQGPVKIRIWIPPNEQRTITVEP